MTSRRVCLIALEIIGLALITRASAPALAGSLGHPESECETCVCAISPTCCTKTWSASCTALAQDPGACQTRCGGTQCDHGIPEPGLPAPLDALRSEGCTWRRAIGRMPPGFSVCPPSPAPAVWQAARLFSAATAALGPSELARYCVYSYLGTGEPPASALVSLPAVAGIPAASWLDRDCLVVVPQAAGDVFEQSRAAFPGAFRTAVEAIPALPGGIKQQPRIAVIDNFAPPGVPTGLPPNAPEGNSPHGDDVAALIRWLGCDAQGVCPLVVRPYLGITILDRDAQSKVIEGNRGYFGYQSRVALALAQALGDWVNADAQSNPLVINLSLGWDPIYSANDECDGRTRVGVQAVKQLLALGACRGALTFAAAGNAAGGAASGAGDGPMAPAVWEADAPYSLSQCQWVCQSGAACLASLQAPTAGCGAGECYRPLLHAVAGVDGADAWIATHRPNSVSPLVAPAAFAVTGPQPAVDPAWQGREAMTGTSVSTAVASTAAALVWAYRADMGAGGVAGLLRNHGEKVGSHPDVCQAAPEQDCAEILVRRISLCRSAAAAAGIANPATLGCTKIAAFQGLASPLVWNAWQIALRIAATQWSSIVNTAGYGENQRPDECTPGDVWTGEPFPPDADAICPDELYPNGNLRPYDVVPQPTIDPCGRACMYFFSTDQLVLEANARLPGPLTQPVLTLRDLAGVAPPLTVDLGHGIPQFVPGQRYLVSGLSIDPLRGYDTAEIIFWSDGVSPGYVRDTVLLTQ